MKEVIVIALNVCGRALEGRWVAHPGTTKGDDKVTGQGTQKMKLSKS